MRLRDLIMPTATATACALVLAVAGCGSSSSTSSSSTTSAHATSSSSAASNAAPTTASTTASGPRVGFEGVPLQQGPDLASPGTTRPTPVDGIQCKPSEQLAYHIHSHLTVFDDGRLYALPGGVGIPGSQTEDSQYGPVAVGGQCYFWLHTHTADGVIHVESPLQKIFTLGDFFDVWRQPLTSGRIAGLQGKVSAFVNGKVWHKSPRAIPLLPHVVIQLEIGEPIPPLLAVNWRKTGL